MEVIPERNTYSLACYPREDWNKKPKLKHGFGMDLTMTNCLYDNMMENITKKCDCKTLTECNDETKWKCASDILGDPYTYLKEPIYCLEACNTTIYTPMIKSKKMLKEPKLCGSKWLNAVKTQCDASISNTEGDNYSDLCSQVSTKVTACGTGTTDGDTITFSDAPILQKYAKENLISLQIYFKQYWFKHSVTVKAYTGPELWNGIIGVLVAVFGFSLMSIPELLFYLFCGRGGGCVCRPIMKNCSD